MLFQMHKISNIETNMRCMTVDSGQAPEYEQPHQQRCRGRGRIGAQTQGRCPLPTSQLPFLEKDFLGIFYWEHKLAITSVLTECRDTRVPTNLMTGSLQTFANHRVHFQGPPQSSVDISFWYLKQPQRKDHNRADSCAPAACTRLRPWQLLG